MLTFLAIVEGSYRCKSCWVLHTIIRLLFNCVRTTQVGTINIRRSDTFCPRDTSMSFVTGSVWSIVLNLPKIVLVRAGVLGPAFCRSYSGWREWTACRLRAANRLGGSWLPMSFTSPFLHSKTIPLILHWDGTCTSFHRHLTLLVISAAPLAALHGVVLFRGRCQVSLDVISAGAAFEEALILALISLDASIFFWHLLDGRNMQDTYSKTRSRRRSYMYQCTQRSL